jgi:hypothetical protein
MAIPHIILFRDANCSGDHMHVCEGMPYVGDTFNDATSSFIILEGVWEFFADAEFKTQMISISSDVGFEGVTGRLGPGVYNWIEDRDTLGPNTDNKLSSLFPVRS